MVSAARPPFSQLLAEYLERDDVSGQNGQIDDHFETGILGHLELCRAEVARHLDSNRRVTLGQFLTPAKVALLMASMFPLPSGKDVRLLDPGAGVGTLFAACVEIWCAADGPPKKIQVTAYEIEPLFLPYLKDTIEACRAICRARNVDFEAHLITDDFIKKSVASLRQDLFSPPSPKFTHAILNPPYHKIQSNSATRRLLSACGIETSNFYTGFLALTSRLLERQGQMVSITPRSFCNGLYFKPFRKQFLATMSISRLHLFHSRSEAFREDDVLQENLIMHASKSVTTPETISISSSFGDDEEPDVRQVERSEVVDPSDPEAFIRIATNDYESDISKQSAKLSSSLDSLGLKVSTGRVVDFRAREFIINDPQPETVPLIYPAHFDRGYIRWPRNGGKKPNAIMINAKTKGLLLPSVNYVVVKRFSSKEQPKRVVAAIYQAGCITASHVAFENHVNYFHRNNGVIGMNLAKGLAAFLNSTFLDTVFRHFSGHTQVNAVDLRQLRYPNLNQLETIGSYIGEEFPPQEKLDSLVNKELFDMTTSAASETNAAAKAQIEKALGVLKTLGLPRAQQNERSALTLLALLDLKPDTLWKEAGAPLMGITPMMEFFSRHYGKTYAPNTRETVRRQTVHQFRDAGLIVENPDDLSRPTNSPKAVYQIEAQALELLRTFGSSEWEGNLKTYIASGQTLKERYAREREMKRIPVGIAMGRTIALSPGGQNVLIQKVIDEFGSRFTPDGQVAYIGDTAEKFAYFDEGLLRSLGVKIEAHGKMPDVIIYYSERNWLVLVEAVTSHGPVDPKRRGELKTLFKDSKAGLVFVTAFLTRRAMVEYLSVISWETEVWVAEAPSHLIHFNGERFLGPYPV